VFQASVFHKLEVRPLLYYIPHSFGQNLNVAVIVRERLRVA